MISRFFLATRSACRGASILKSFSSGWVRLSDRFELKIGLYEVRLLLESRLLLLQPTLMSAPV